MDQPKNTTTTTTHHHHVGIQLTGSCPSRHRSQHWRVYCWSSRLAWFLETMTNSPSRVSVIDRAGSCGYTMRCDCAVAWLRKLIMLVPARAKLGVLAGASTGPKVSWKLFCRRGRTKEPRVLLASSTTCEKVTLGNDAGPAWGLLASEMAEEGEGPRERA